MNDFDKRLAESLKAVTEALREDRVERSVRARADFWRRLRRRRVLRFTWVAAVAGATALIVAFAVTQGGDIFRPDRTTPTVPAPPAGTYIGVARGPVGVSVGGGIVWVGSKSGTLTQVDPATDRSIAQVSVGGHPSDIAVADDLVWYSDSADGTVKRVSAVTSQFVGAPVAIGSGAGHIDVDIGPKGTVWVASPDTGTLYAIDAGTGDVVNNEYMTRPVELGIGPGALWALAEDGRTLVRIDFATGQESLRVSLSGDLKTDIAVTSGGVFVAATDGTITQIAADGTILGEFSAPGTNPELAVGKGALWVASDTGDGHAELAQLDPANLHQIHPPVKFLGTPTDIALGEGSVWVTDSSRNAVVRLDIAH